MRILSARVPRLAALAALAWSLPLGLEASAQSTAAITDSCFVFPAKLADTAVQAFKDQAADFLGRFPQGNPLMTAEVRRLAGSDVSTVAVFLQLAAQASLPQQVAIGRGLAGAAFACSTWRSGLAEDINQAVTLAGIPEVSAAFTAGLSAFELPLLLETQSIGNNAFGPAGIQGLGSSGGPTGSVGGPAPSGLVFFAPSLIITSSSGGSARFFGGGVLSTLGSSVSPTR